VRRLLPVLCLAGALVVAGCSSFGVGIPTSRLTEMVQARLGQQQQQQQQQQQGQAQPQDIEGLTRQALEGLIQFQLVLDGVREAGVQIDEGDVDARMNQLKSQVEAQGRKYEDVLREQNLTDAVVRDQQRVQLAVDLMAVKLVPYSPDAELRKALDKRKDEFLELHVRHVLVKDKQTADKARKELVASGDWSGVAKQRSIDPQSKEKAGDLGFIAKGQTVKQFETAELGLADKGSCKGKTQGTCASPISQPVKTQFGFHVLQVVGVRLPALDNDLRAKLEPTVKDRRQAAVQQWFDGLVKQADVTVNPRFGRWDPETGKVVERQTAPGSATTTTGPMVTPTSQP
jgi:parvulin-like peptidyl-prolyl isomerase